MAKVLFKYGTQSQYNSLLTKDPNSLYFITDSNRIYKGEDLVASKDVKLITELPVGDSILEDTIYIKYDQDKRKYSMYIKNQENTLDEIELGSSTPLFTDVKYDASKEGNNAEWTFTLSDGSTKLISTPKENFLQSAKINEKNQLELTMVNGDKVTVDLAEMIATTDTVKLTEDVPFIGVTPFGGIPSTGFKRDQTLTQIIKSLVQKEADAKVTNPSLTISMSGAGTSVEAGTNVKPTINGSFSKGSYAPGLPADTGVKLTGYTLIRTDNSNSTNVVNNNPTIQAFTESDNIQVGDGGTLTYKATCAHTAGATPTTNMGNQSSQSAIAQQTARQSNIVTISGYRQFFIGASSDKPELTSSIIRNLALKSAYSTGAKTFTVPVGSRRVIIACPATKTGMKKVINKSALNADVTSTFSKKTIKVEGANGFTAVDYNVWVFEPDVPYGQQAILEITLA